MRKGTNKKTKTDLPDSHPYPAPGNDKGSVVGSAASSRNSTGQKKVQEALKESEEHLRQAHELLEEVTAGTNVIIAAIDNNFNYTFFNNAYREELLRLTQKNITTGTNMVALFEDMPEQQRILLEEWSRPLRGERTSKDLAFGEPGKYRRTYNVLHTPIRDSQGVVIGAGEVAVDITRQVRAEEALLKARDELEMRIEERTAELKKALGALGTERQRLYDVLEALPVYVCLLDKDYRMPFANRYFRETFREPEGRRCYDFLFDRTGPCETCETYTVMKIHAPHHWYWTGPNGRDYDIYDFPFTDTDGSSMILEMGIDITERKKAEEASQKANAYNRSLIEASLDRKSVV